MPFIRSSWLQSVQQELRPVAVILRKAADMGN